MVLCLHNLTFVHSIMLDTLTEINSMSSRKFRGKFVHAAMQNCIVSGATTHVESKERAFSAVKSISSSTSSNRPEHVIGNLFVRLHTEQNASKVTTGKDKDKSEVAELYSMITKIPNTFHLSILLQTQENGKPVSKEFQTFCCLDLKFSPIDDIDSFTSDT